VAAVEIIDERTISISVKLEDAIAMVTEASLHLDTYAQEIITIYEKMPEFEYTYFCFYAYDSATLFERILEVDPKS
jgi:hypothetical protein